MFGRISPLLFLWRMFWRKNSKTANVQGHDNIKISFYQYRKSHCGDKTIFRASYLHNEISYTDMISLYCIGAQGHTTPWRDYCEEQIPQVISKLRLDHTLTRNVLNKIPQFWNDIFNAFSWQNIIVLCFIWASLDKKAGAGERPYYEKEKKSLMDFLVRYILVLTWKPIECCDFLGIVLHEEKRSLILTWSNFPAWISNHIPNKVWKYTSLPTLQRLHRCSSVMD